MSKAALGRGQRAFGDPLWWLRRRVLTEPARRDAALAEGLRAVETRWPDLPQSQEEPVFLFAAGWRSGSTLLQRLLNSSPETVIWGEPYEYLSVLDSLLAPLSRFSAEIPPEGAFPPPVEKLSQEQVREALTKRFIANLTPPMEDLKQAHWAFHDTLFGRAARAAGRDRWGLKLVRCTAAVARYLRWLYPNAKLVYLYRDPFAAYRSYAGVTLRGKAPWYWRYPDYPVTHAAQFALLWRLLMRGFLDSREQLGALLLSYESLTDGSCLEHLDRFLGVQIDRSVLQVRVGGSREKPRLGAIERWVIAALTGNLRRRADADVRQRVLPRLGAIATSRG